MTVATAKEEAFDLHQRGWRVKKDRGEGTDYYELITPNTGLVLKFQNRFDEPTGIDNSVLGFRQVSGYEIEFSFTPSAELFDEIAKHGIFP
ncbi:MAG: hypothetical protein WCV58_02515 [Patescibacteria group bacterium]